MFQLKSLQVSKTHKILWDFFKWTNHQIPTITPDLVVIKKKRENVDSAAIADHKVKIKESEKVDK